MGDFWVFGQILAPALVQLDLVVLDPYVITHHSDILRGGALPPSVVIGPVPV